MFRRIFGHVGNEDITKDLINSILDKKVNTITLNESPILDKDLKNDKVGILDIKAVLDNKMPCDIEMQVVKYSNIAKRILYYWSKLFSSQIVEGNDYNNLNKTITILIADFEIDIAKDIPKIHTKWEIREEEYCKKVLTDILEIHIIELPKLVKKLTDNKKDNKDLQLWLKFILSPNEIGDKDMDENKEIKKAKKELEKIKQDKVEQERALRRMMYVMDQKAIQQYGYEQGIDRGVRQGIMQEKTNIAKKLLKMHISLEQIVKATGLTKKEVEKLRNKN